MKKTGLIIGAVVLLVLSVGSSCVGKYNQIVAQNEAINAAWSQVENVLQRRADLIPNLVNTVKGIAQQEQTVFIGVAEARSKVAGAQTIPDKIAANQQLDSALSRLLLVVEKYPELKSNQNFLALQDELAGTENRIAVERKRYNDAVQSYNTFIKQFPNNLMASLGGFAPREEYFKANEAAKEAPKVQF